MAAATVSKALKVAIIGSGPSAFYSAARLLSAATAASTTEDVQVHMYERLPTPHGLVRYGVAPDHPEVKNVENKFTQVASDPRFHFFGNVNVVGDDAAAAAAALASTQAAQDNTHATQDGAYVYPHSSHVSLGDLLPHYSHVLFSYGCSFARSLGVPGSGEGELANVHAALDVVNWYNGHPAAHDDKFLTQQPWRRVALRTDMRHATIVGAGNVALDVARILLRARSTLDELFTADTAIKARAALRETDIPEPVLAALSQCRIDHVDIVARRGPAQLAFTNKEVREMMDLQSVAFERPSVEHMALAQEQVRALEAQAKTGEQAAASEARVRKRLLGLLDKGSVTTAADAKARWSLSFFKGPGALLPSSSQEDRVGAVQWDEMAFDRVPSLDDRERPWSGGGAPGQQRVRLTGRQSTTSTDMVVASVGYKAAPLSGASAGLPWDASKAIVPNNGGQVVDGDGKRVPGMYVSGWLARGPVGVIASTRIDANSVVEQMLHDWQASDGGSGLTTAHTRGEAVQPGVPDAVRQSSHKVVSWSDWLRLDAEETRRGKELGKLREKVLSVEEMLRVIG